MDKELTPQEIEEHELAAKIKELIKEDIALYHKRSNGITLEKNEYIGDRMRDIEKEIEQLKTKK